MKPYLVRLKSDKQNAREIVGFYVSQSLNELAELVDECCDVTHCEYRELGPGGIFWEHLTGSPVPRAAEPDWEELADDWSVVPSDPSLSDHWNEVFRTPEDLPADDTLWTPLRCENDDPKEMDN